MKVPKTTEKPIDELTPSTLPIAPGSPLTWDGTSHRGHLYDDESEVFGGNHHGCGRSI